ncbi:MAG TPA: diguanylate cyclase [Gemmatimonadales bacterium]|jgi:diguanylate cyclase (GGDEF)-like protein|nr:diguanylate cyclase [Gemmatimonadales bacterium]
MNFVIDSDACVACLACVRVCPTNAIAVAPDASMVRVIDETCIRCGLCVPECPHDAVQVSGELGRAVAIAAEGTGVLILGTESAAHFYPVLPEQVVNACYAAGFRVVSRGVIGDELVANEYLRLWRSNTYGTLIRSTDPVVVEAIRAGYPELVPYLAPVATPPVAEARYLRSLYGDAVKVVYAGLSSSPGAPELDAWITFEDLSELLRLRGVTAAAQPTVFARLPQERRRHLSAAGGMPLKLLEELSQTSKRFQKLRGLSTLPALHRAVAVDRVELGFVDILASEGALDHPLSGPREELYWRRSVVQSSEPPRSLAPVVEPGVVASIGAVFDIKPRRQVADAAAVQQVLKTVGLGPNGRPWDCRACGYDTCREFAEAAALGRASMKQCTPYQERRADESQREAATDLLTGLATFRVLRDRLTQEVERSKRSGERFTVLFLDLDRLKEINDAYGHEAGNEVLKAVAAEVRAAVRASDLAARYGGDEFVVILTRTQQDGAERVAEALREGIENVGRRLGYPLGAVTVSVGIAEFDPEHPAGGDLLVNADRALYRAKASGRNTVV